MHKNKKKLKAQKKAQKEILLTNWHPERGAAHLDIYNIFQILATRQVNSFSGRQSRPEEDEASPKPRKL